jgi:hypothetical protein
MGTFFCAAILLFEASITLSPVYPKLSYLTGFLFILYLFLPYILAGLYEIDFLMAFSPLGYFAYAYGHYQEGMPSALHLEYFSLSGAGRLVLRRYSQIIAMRKGLSSDSTLTTAALCPPQQTSNSFRGVRTASRVSRFCHFLQPT